MGNAKTEKTKRYKKRRREREAFYNSICMLCKKEDKTVDNTGLCEACRVEELEKELLMETYSYEENNGSANKTISISISKKLYREITEALPVYITLESLIIKLLRAWKQEPSINSIKKETKEETKKAIITASIKVASKKRKEKILPVSVQVSKHVNCVRNNKTK